MSSAHVRTPECAVDHLALCTRFPCPSIALWPRGLRGGWQDLRRQVGAARARSRDVLPEGHPAPCRREVRARPDLKKHGLRVRDQNTMKIVSE